MKTDLKYYNFFFFYIRETEINCTNKQTNTKIEAIK